MRRAPRAALVALDLGAVQMWLQTEIMGTHGGVIDSRDGGGEPASRRAKANWRVPPERVVRSDARLSAAARVEVYRDAYVRRLTECLADDYPALQFALGEASFTDLCRDYITARPSSSPSLNFFGRHMASFCRSRTDWPRSVFASDLAALEWALVEALHAETLPALTLADLQSFAGRSWADAKLVPNPAVRLVSTEYPVNGFFQAFRDEETPSIPARTASTVAVFRQEYTIARKELAGTEEVVLRALLSGTSVGASLALAAERLPSPLDGNAVGGWFRSWFSNGFFIAIEGSTD